jgi:RimJ/RimL family protein N-acetyltransferase
MEITQRTATLGDAAILLTWRNNPLTREFSHHSELIQRDEHLEWLTARLERAQFEPFFLFSADYKAIGMSRLDILSGSVNKYEISILVDPNQHGKGIGTRILNMTCEAFFGLHPSYTIVASVHQNNSVSQNLFTSHGFELVPSEGDFIHFEKKL